MTAKANKFEGMVYFPAARFMMGSPDGILTHGNETPRHKVELSAYYLDVHGVTNAEYNAYLATIGGQKKFKAVATTCGSSQSQVVATGDNAKKLYDSNRSRAGSCGLHVEPNNNNMAARSNPYPEGFDGPDQPVVNVSWPDADAYCKAQGKHLPTEAQWERAAWGLTKGYDTRRKAGTRSGQVSSEEAVYNTDRTANVCSKPKNDAGLCDMAGNTWQWVADWYNKDYYKNSPAKDPTGPETGVYRVLRGGSWGYISGSLRAADRFSAHPAVHWDVIGFRCASSPE